MARWSNKLPDGTYKTKGYGRSKWQPFRHEKCPFCGRKYRYFRAELNKQAFEIIKAERDDPNHPRTQVDLTQLLGKKRELKLKAWEAHQAECELIYRYKNGEEIPEEEWEYVAGLTSDNPGYFVDTTTEKKRIYPGGENETD